MFYGTGPRLRRSFLAITLAAMAYIPSGARADPATDGKVIVALGDSLSAGFMLIPDDAFPNQLEAALRKRGHDVRVINAGLSGDTAAGGLARLDWAVPAEADIVIVELGANDALRGLDPAKTKAALDKIISRLRDRGMAVLLAGMEAPRNMGRDYVRRFGAIYPALAKKHGVPRYPFFLEGVAGNPKLNLQDGLHPNAKGVGVIVERILPWVEKLLGPVASPKG